MNPETLGRGHAENLNQPFCGDLQRQHAIRPLSKCAGTRSPPLPATWWSSTVGSSRRLQEWSVQDGHARLKIDAGVQVYFCDPQSPWQRGTNENTNGLLRQYFPKGTDLSVHSAEELAAVQAALNTRPRKTLGWRTPAGALDEWLR